MGWWVLSLSICHAESCLYTICHSISILQNPGLITRHLDNGSLHVRIHYAPKVRYNTFSLRNEQVETGNKENQLKDLA